MPTRCMQPNQTQYQNMRSSFVHPRCICLANGMLILFWLMIAGGERSAPRQQTLYLSVLHNHAYSSGLCVPLSRTHCPINSPSVWQKKSLISTTRQYGFCDVLYVQHSGIYVDTKSAIGLLMPVSKILLLQCLLVLACICFSPP